MATKKPTGKTPIVEKEATTTTTVAVKKKKEVHEATGTNEKVDLDLGKDCETKKSLKKESNDETPSSPSFGENPWKLIHQLDCHRTEAMYIRNVGCVVRHNDQLTFVPGARINETINPEGVVINREIVKQ